MSHGWYRNGLSPIKTNQQQDEYWTSHTTQRKAKLEAENCIQYIDRHSLVFIFAEWTQAWTLYDPSIQTTFGSCSPSHFDLFSDADILFPLEAKFPHQIIKQNDMESTRKRLSRYWGPLRT